MTVRTRDNKVTKVLVMMDRVLRGIKGDDQGAEDRKEVEPKVLTNQLVKIARQMLEESEARNKMELQLSNMQKLLEKLVNNQDFSSRNLSYHNHFSSDFYHCNSTFCI